LYALGDSGKKRPVPDLWGIQEAALKTITILVMAMLCSTAFAQARGGHGGGRVSYGGGHHTSSHGGTYMGGAGSSHRGGHYQNFSTGNRYGTHK
jgi:uncharacterized membrane protein YgcG